MKLKAGRLLKKEWVLICPHCQRSWFYYKKKTHTFACRKCGHEFTANPDAIRTRTVQNEKGKK
jgi:DNA-directed RNA polymerase subunit M/transcription elongation factor TFIIS